MSVAVVCPTRGRAVAFSEMRKSVGNTSNASILSYVDSDDPSGYKLCAGMTVGPPIGRGPAINVLCDDNREFDYYLLASDDVVFIREGWDREIEQLFPGDELAVLNVARERGEPQVNWPCVSRKWIDTLGWFSPPTLGRYCQDTALQALGDALGRTIYMEHDILRHNGICREGAAADLAKDSEAFLWFMARSFKGCLDKLRAEMS